MVYIKYVASDTSSNKQIHKRNVSVETGGLDLKGCLCCTKYKRGPFDNIWKFECLCLRKCEMWTLIENFLLPSDISLLIGCRPKLLAGCCWPRIPGGNTTRVVARQGGNIAAERGNKYKYKYQESCVSATKKLAQMVLC